MIVERGNGNYLRGYWIWLKDFKKGMSDDRTYWMRLGTQPKREVLYVYLCIDGKVKFRSNYVCSYGPGEMTFDGGRTLYAKAWVVMTGPVEKAPYKTPMKGFRGFRYTEKLF